MLQEPLNSVLEGALLASFDLGYAEVTTNGDAMHAFGKVRTSVVLCFTPAAAKDLVSNLLLLGRVRRVSLAPISVQGNPCRLELSKSDSTSSSDGCDCGRLDDAIKGEVEDVARAEAVTDGCESGDAAHFEAHDQVV